MALKDDSDIVRPSFSFLWYVTGAEVAMEPIEEIPLEPNAEDRGSPLQFTDITRATNTIHTRRLEKYMSAVDIKFLRHYTSASMADSTYLSSFDVEIRNRRAQKYDHQLESQVIAWISSVVCESKPEDLTFAEWLKSGEILCKLANMIKPNCIINRVL
jgi:hypothetical protein